MTTEFSSQTILVPVDFSSHSRAALLKACELSSCVGLPVVILHVVHDPSELPGYYAKMAKKKHLLRMEDIAQEMFDEFMSSLVDSHPELDCLRQAKRLLVVGLPVGRTLEVAEREHSAMIVMGSHGRTGLQHLMLGSKAEQIVRMSPVSVTIVKEGLS